MKKWEVENLGFFTDKEILRALKQGWIRLDDRVRSNPRQSWTRIRIRFRPQNRFLRLIDTPSAYAGFLSGAGLIIFGTVAASLLLSYSWFGLIFVLIAGILGWEFGHTIGHRIGYQRRKKLPTKRRYLPWIVSILQPGQRLRIH